MSRAHSSYCFLTLCMFFFPPSRRAKFLRPAHSSSCSRDSSKNDPKVCRRIYLKNQLSSGQLFRISASHWPKPPCPTLTHWGSCYRQPCSCSNWVSTEPKPCSQQAPHGWPRCSSWPHHQEASTWAMWSRYCDAEPKPVQSHHLVSVVFDFLLLFLFSFKMEFLICQSKKIAIAATCQSIVPAFLHWHLRSKGKKLVSSHLFILSLFLSL